MQSTITGSLWFPDVLLLMFIPLMNVKITPRNTCPPPCMHAEHAAAVASFITQDVLLSETATLPPAAAAAAQRKLPQSLAGVSPGILAKAGALRALANALAPATRGALPEAVTGAVEGVMQVS